MLPTSSGSTWLMILRIVRWWACPVQECLPTGRLKPFHSGQHPNSVCNTSDIGPELRGSNRAKSSLRHQGALHGSWPECQPQLAHHALRLVRVALRKPNPPNERGKDVMALVSAVDSSGMFKIVWRHCRIPWSCPAANSATNSGRTDLT